MKNRIGRFLLLLLIICNFCEIVYLKKNMKLKLHNKKIVNALKNRYMTDCNFNNIILLERNIKNVKELLHDQNIDKVAIYGIGAVGQKLIDLFLKANVSICYGIDQNSSNLVKNLQVLKPEEISNDMDMIIVTPEMEFDDIKKKLETRINIPIVRLSELLEELLLFSNIK